MDAIGDLDGDGGMEVFVQGLRRSTCTQEVTER